MGRGVDDNISTALDW